MPADRRAELPLTIRFAAGAAVLHLVFFALLALGWGTRGPVLAVSGAAAAAGVVELWRRRAAFRRPPWWFLAIAAVFGAVYAVNALTPEIQADANIYHLMPAVEAARTGGFTGEVSFYDRLPHAAELLFLPAYYVAGDSGARLAHLLFFFATPALLVAFARQAGFDATAAWIAAAMYFCVPVAGLSAMSAFNDAALVFYTLAAAWAMLARRALLAGLFAGMCYAVKMNGGIAIAAGGLYFGAAREWRAAATFSAAALATTLPWAIRNLIDTGNPFAPFFNAWFPNPYFYAAVEAKLGAQLRSYGVAFHERFVEVAAGWKLQGVIGPVFLLAPVAVLGWRRQGVRTALAFAAVFSAGWWLNAGARFLLPALPFVALAMAAAVPRRAAFALLGVHAALSWPAAVPLYAGETWRITEFPWRAALGLESRAAYLERVSPEHRMTELVRTNTRPGDRVLDLFITHRARLDRDVVGPWQTALGNRLVAALELAWKYPAAGLYELRAAFPARLVTGVRVRQTGESASPWAVSQIAIEHGEAAVRPSRDWLLEASANRWDAPFAFDRNPVSRWSTWGASEPGDFIEVDFGGPAMADAVTVLGPVEERTVRPVVEVRTAAGEWVRVEAARRPAPALNLRAYAMDLLRREGITHIATASGTSGVGLLGTSFVEDRESWRIEVVANLDGFYVLRLR